MTTHALTRGLRLRTFRKYGRQTCPCHSATEFKMKSSLTNSYFRRFSSQINIEDVPMENIRNFCIIAHVDHGKSTLADRLLEITGAIVKSKDNKQVLDRLPVERERGITVKSVAASLRYVYDSVEYCLNLIDTPGHVDFSNEVSRSLAACQGAVLLIDANEGVQAQTMANFYLAFSLDLVIIPAINKIDLQSAKPEKVEKELTSLFEFEPSSILRISGKTGLGVQSLLEKIIRDVPPPKASRDPPFKALLIDSWFERWRGAMCFLYVANGQIRLGDEITSFKSGKSYQIKTIGLLTPEEMEISKLAAGQVGVVSCGMKTAEEATAGDTLYSKGATVEPLKSFEKSKPMVYSGLFPKDQSEHLKLKASLEKLCLNDPSVTTASETSPALGNGWRLGFLGLLHLDVFRQRLEQEFGTEAVLTAPSVPYRVKIFGSKKVKKYASSEVEIRNPADLPDENIVREILEPYVNVTILSPANYFQQISDECSRRRAEQIISNCLDNERTLIKCLMPLSEVIVDFHDVLKSTTSGYASFDYEHAGYRPSHLRKLTVLLNGKEVEELVTLVHVSKARTRARIMADKLKELIPRQQVLIVIQVCVKGDVLARSEIKPYRKDVTAKLYGRDVTRRTKLLKQQAEGKKKMREFFNIQIPRDTFVDVLKER